MGLIHIICDLLFSKPFQKGKRKWDKLKEGKAPEKQLDKKPRLKCSHCKKPGHDESTCYSKRDGKPASVGAIFAQEIDEGNEIDLNKLAYLDAIIFE